MYSLIQHYRKKKVKLLRKKVQGSSHIFIKVTIKLISNLLLFFIINIILFLQITCITSLISKLTILETKLREREREEYIFKGLLIPEKLVFFNFIVEQLRHSLPSRWSRGAIEEYMCFFLFLILLCRGLHHRPRQCDTENQSTRASELSNFKNV